MFSFTWSFTSLLKSRLADQISIMTSIFLTSWIFEYLPILSFPAWKYERLSVIIFLPKPTFQGITPQPYTFSLMLLTQNPETKCRLLFKKKKQNPQKKKLLLEPPTKSRCAKSQAVMKLCQSFIGYNDLCVWTQNHKYSKIPPNGYFS